MAVTFFWGKVSSVIRIMIAAAQEWKKTDTRNLSRSMLHEQMALFLKECQDFVHLMCVELRLELA